ncbi:hypothetical protein ACEF99_002597 [Salmonella enterica subsp. enterica serovar Newport]
MAKYFIRVELHCAKGNEYDRLHELMEQQGCHRALFTGDPAKKLEPGLAMISQFRQLPTGTYILESPFSIDRVVMNIADIASRVEPNPMVVVVDCADMRHANLPLAS